jgi:outer membrane protein assembly factor BamB
MNRSEIQELLPLVALGIASAEERAVVRHALEADAELRREYHDLERTLSGLGATEPVTPPSTLKNRVLEAARQEATITPRVPAPAPERGSRSLNRASRGTTRAAPSARGRGWMGWTFGGVTAAVAIVLSLTLLNPGVSAVNASVVATMQDGGLIYANSGRNAAPIVLVRADRTRIPVKFAAREPCVFTDAASSDGLAYLLDAKNSKLFIVDERSGALVDEWPVPAGAAGLDVRGDLVVVKGAISGTAAIFRKAGVGEKTMIEARVAPRLEMPMQEVMDAAIIQGERVYATHHVTGEIAVLEVNTGRELARYKTGGKPVSLGFDGDALLVLDYEGRLLRLETSTGAVLGETRLQGNPDRLSVMDGIVYLSDRDGFVTAVRAESLEVLGRRRLEGVPMDLTPMADGHVAVAVSQGGVVVLDRDLRTLERLN